jgi:uncharacterized protein YvpB
MKITGWASALLLFGLCLAAWGCHPSQAAVRAPVSTPAVETDSATRTPSRLPSDASLYMFDGTATACLPDPHFAEDGSLLPTATLPPAALIRNIRGTGQSLPLDCESNSAVDWAAFFGTDIDELEFFGRLPVSDDPNRGFVGNVHGAWGNLPPKGYGVYAGPVAKLLRDYGVEAYAYRGLEWEQMRQELAAGRPVFVWVVGHVWRSTPVTMTVEGGETILAARLEHTVILIGYTATMATVLDETSKYSVPIQAFLDSWNTLGAMAILGRMLPARPDCAGRAVELVP